MVVNAPFWKLFVFDRLDTHMCHTATCHGQDQPFLLHISELWNRLSLPGWHFGKLGQLRYVGCLQKWSTLFGHHSQWLDVVGKSFAFFRTQMDSTWFNKPEAKNESRPGTSSDGHVTIRGIAMPSSPVWGGMNDLLQPNLLIENWTINLSTDVRGLDRVRDATIRQ